MEKRKASSIKMNLIYQIIYQVLTMILPFITAPYVARILGAENIGIHSYTYTIAMYFVYFAALGINNHGSRLIAQVKHDQKRLNYEFTNLFLDHLLVALTVLVCYCIYVIFFSQYKLIAALQGMLVIGAVLDVNWLFFGLEKFKLTVTRNIIIKICTVLGILCFVKTKDDLALYTLIMAFGTLASQSVICFFVHKEVKLVRPSWNRMKENFSPLIMLFIAVIAVTLYRTMDKVMLGQMCDMEKVGFYENADKLIMYPVSIITALGTVMLPRMSSLYKNKSIEAGKKTLEISLEFAVSLSVGMCFGLMAVAKNFSVWFYGQDFLTTGYILEVISLTIPFMAFNNVIRTQYIIPTNKDKVYLYAVLLGVVTNFLLNYLLIPVWGVYGAAIGTISADGIAFLFQILALRRFVPIGKYLQYFLPSISAGIGMLIVLKFLENAVPFKNGLLLIFQIVLGMVVYLLILTLCSLLQKNSFIRTLVLKKLGKV